ncbi:MAG: ATP-binding protein [Deltaproteobacteria bacterium]|nr:ATP-binding protein [Deltaproteobacteria bacterium]
MSGGRWQFAIQNDLRYVAWLRSFFPAAVRVADIPLSARGCWQCTLVLVEAVNNAVLHGHRGDHSPWITMTLVLRPKRVQMTVMNPGPPFRLPPSHRVPPLEQTDGRGLYLIMEYCRRVRLRRVQRQNILEMTYVETA